MGKENETRLRIKTFEETDTEAAFQVFCVGGVVLGVVASTCETFESDVKKLITENIDLIVEDVCERAPDLPEVQDP